jgi:vitamin B12 transporter
MFAMSIRILLTTTCLLGALPTTAAFAAQATATPEIVVTANRMATPKDQVGSSVSVITRADIEQSGASQVFDVIKNVPGIAVSRTGGFGAAANVRLRGSNPGQVRVMIDGVFVNDPSGVNTEYDFASLPVGNIERIEILRGPQSALYGSDAMGGVINIITRKGEKGSPQYNGQVEIGSFQTYRQSGGVSGATDKVNYSLQLQNDQNKGFSRSSLGSEKDGAHDRTVGATFGVKLTSNLKLDVSGNYSNLDTDFDPSARTDGPASTNRKTMLGRTALTLNTFDGAWQHIASLQGARTERENNQPTSSSNRFSAFDGEQYAAEYQTNLKLRERDVATLGAVSEKQQATANRTTSAGAIVQTLRERDFTTNSLYGQYMFGLGKGTTFTFGGRHDDHSLFGSANTYRLTAAQELNEGNTVMRSSVGTGFKAPTLTQLYGPFGANPNLNPEESTGYDLGVEQRFLNKKLLLGVTGFYNDYKNLIGYTSGYVNINKASTQGIESIAEYKISPEWEVRASHTYLLAKDETTTFNLLRRPKHSFLVGTDYTVLGKASIGGDVRYVSQMGDVMNVSPFGTMYIKPFTTVDLRGSYDIDQNLTMYSRIENILDKRYQETNDYTAPGAAVYVGLRARY